MFKKIIVVACLFSISLFSQAEGDASKGKQKAAVCAGCHGALGVPAIPSYPTLAGKEITFLESALKDYRAKKQRGAQSAIMFGMAGSLSDDDISNLATFFNSLATK